MGLVIMTLLYQFSLVLSSLLLPFVAAKSLPPGFVKEFVVNRPAVTGLWAKNPRQNGKPMLIIASDSGKVRALEDPDESDKVITILDLRMENEEICTNGERGVQSLVLHPDFDENFLIYLFYMGYREGCLEGAEVSPSNVVNRFRMDPDTLILDKDSKEEIWRGGPTTKQNHNGGALAFGNDGKLYVTTGDGGDGDNVQPLNNSHGSIIRLNDDGSVPSDNPFANQDEFNSYRCADSGGVVPEDAPEDAVCSEVFANGFRNPFRIEMDPNEKEKVQFAVSDVGGGYWEEMSWAGTDFSGRNYGYPKHEGPCLHGYAHRCQLPSDKNILEPFHWYAHRRVEEGGCVTGSVIVPENSGWPPEYKFLFADFIFFEIYNLIEDPDAYCRACRPPTSGYRNETFYRVPPGEPGEGRGSITDIFFGPYKDTQALYVATRGGKESIIRIRYTDDVSNSPPVPVIRLKDLDSNFTVGEEFEFDGSESSDPDNDELEFDWDFDDGTLSNAKKPTHAFSEPGKYDVTLVVTDTAGISQQTSMVVNVGNPPTVSILSPLEGDKFFVGQIFQLKGEAYNHEGKSLNDSQLTWEVRKHHADHFHPFLDRSNGNNLQLFPAPEPEDFFASTNSYLQIILKATDDNGLTAEVDRLVQPLKINVDIESDPPGIEVIVDAYPLKTSEQIVSWKSHKLNVFAKDQPPFKFKSWWDGNRQRERKIELQTDGQSILAIYCAQELWFCVSDEECCSGSCAMMACTSETASADSSAVQLDESDDDSNSAEDTEADFEEDVEDTSAVESSNIHIGESADDFKNEESTKVDLDEGTNALDYISFQIDGSSDDSKNEEDTEVDIEEDATAIGSSNIKIDNSIDDEEETEFDFGEDIADTNTTGFSGIQIDESGDISKREDNFGGDPEDLNSFDPLGTALLTNVEISDAALSSSLEEHVSLGPTGVALIAVACVIVFIAFISRYSMSKRNFGSRASNNLNDDNKILVREGNSNTSCSDEENGNCQKIGSSNASLDQDVPNDASAGSYSSLANSYNYNSNLIGEGHSNIIYSDEESGACEKVDVDNSVDSTDSKDHVHSASSDASLDRDVPNDALEASFPQAAKLNDGNENHVGEGHSNTSYSLEEKRTRDKVDDNYILESADRKPNLEHSTSSNTTLDPDGPNDTS